MWGEYEKDLRGTGIEEAEKLTSLNTNPRAKLSGKQPVWGIPYGHDPVDITSHIGF
jgi:hypothetical protein